MGSSLPWARGWGYPMTSGGQMPVAWLRVHRPRGRQILLEQNDEWAVQRARKMSLKTIAPIGHTPVVALSAVTA